ncbi:MAG: nicotinate-nucleotide adenylyltransferase [Rhodospirillales bacterium]|jgi:nicotinate-nucleotide adenylyltransferase|nr:nicotinate-nucleotide adenylyltransferase [Rhodospirillales bacterium]MDP6885107.1 nicotinate-nucleotide adenylyltransferase [Rhodospirillales bacterium]
MRNHKPRIGLLGGSFNPAHRGHLHISRMALERLALDQVWWLVSPQNPLKPCRDMAPLDERLASARTVADDSRIRVTDVERRLGTRYTADTLDALAQNHPDTRFVWIMGADNLIQIPRWRRWTALFKAVPIAVFARPSYSLRALSGRAAGRFARARKRESRAGALATMRPPAWVFLHTPLVGASSTRIRDRAGNTQGSGTDKG